MKIALVHDYLAQNGGAELVLQSFHEMWPEAPIFVLFYNKKFVPEFCEADVRQSFIAHLPFGKSHFQWYLPWMPLATERHNLHDFDVVISSTSAFAKGILTRPETLHISYCHTPTRYLWTDTYEYIEDLKYNRLIKSMLPQLIHHLRIWDKMSTDRVDYFIANSRTVKNRIHKYYRRDSDILYPPIDLDLYSISDDVQDYFVTGGRIVPYKRFDLVVDVFNRLKIPVKIFGDGSALEELKKRAKNNVQFLGRVSEKEKAELLRHAQAFIHPQVEDFGITPVEAMASGRPVIAFDQGGATETVIPNKTGVFFHEQTWESLLDAVLQFNPSEWDNREIRTWAKRFSKVQFKERMQQYVKDRYIEFQQDLQQCQLDLR